MTKIAINGLGRIGRAALKIVLETPQLELVAVNDIVPIENVVYLLKYDTAYGRYEKTVEHDHKNLVISGQSYPYYREKDPTRLPWTNLGVDIVLECTGVFKKREDLEKHIQAGAKYVILSAPATGEDVVTVVHGVNTAEEGTRIIACASCTTNCITPVIEIIGRRIGVKKAIMTTVHAYTASQAIVDSPNKRLERGRAGAANFVPTSTGAAVATTKALPQYKDRFDGIAVRGPVTVGSLADIVLVAERQTSAEEVNQIFIEEAASDRYRNIVGVTEEPLVSADIIKDPRASIIHLKMTRVVDGDLVKILSWYDNEWGFTNQMVREAVQIAQTARETGR
ncbi:MAG: glyceraldehyde 3-phosphate dehydrogenase NAD-binding domain-containing protein [Anaerolineaceae bacterium]|jgi:glyceraldehyde 3-phosphate dehydrogenase|nr:glyceraldehyde 3-phosphate dehydrogenase NAD-binding domain-containing protein [Anaerolineaceae bacterium]